MSILALMAGPINAGGMPPALAGNRDLGEYKPVQIYAGSSDIVHQSGTAGAELKQYQVIARNAAGKIVPHNPAAEDSAKEAIGVTLLAVKDTQSVSFIVGGTLNHEALVWDATLTTLAQRQAAFDRTNITIEFLV